jgi:hypothetical protein
MKRLTVFFMAAAVALRAFAGGNTTPVAAPLWAAEGDRKDKVIVVSDLRFGIIDKYSEDVANRGVFVTFVQRLENTADVRELVIAGNFLDEWYLPLTYPAYEDSAKFYRQVVKNNQVVFDELNALMKKTYG